MDSETKKNMTIWSKHAYRDNNITIYNSLIYNRSRFSYSKTNKLTFSGNKQLRFALIIFPAVENTRSELADDTGMQRNFFASSARAGYLDSRRAHHSKGFILWPSWGSLRYIRTRTQVDLVSAIQIASFFDPRYKDSLFE